MKSMDWQFQVGLGTALAFFLFPYAVKDMPAWVTWPGIVVGFLIVLWGMLPNHERIPVGPAFLFIASIAGIVASCFWYRDIANAPSSQPVVSQNSNDVSQNAENPRRETIGETTHKDTLVDLSTHGDEIPERGLLAAQYLRSQGINITKYPDQSTVVLTTSRRLYDYLATRAEENILTQQFDSNAEIGIVTFTLKFSDPLDSISFTRAELWPATSSGVTHPAWKASALDALGNVVNSISEPMIRSFSDVPAQTFTLESPENKSISSLHFESDYRLNGKPFAGFRAILIKQLAFRRKRR